MDLTRTLAAAWASGRPCPERRRAERDPSPAFPRAVPYLVLVLYPVLAIFPWTLDDVSGFPDNDYWNIFGSLLRDGEVTLSAATLLTAQNEHVVLLPKLIYYLNFLLFDGHNAPLRIMAVVLAAGCAVALFRLLPRTLKANRPLALLSSVVIALLVFTYRAHHSWYLGFSGIHWFLANLLFLLALLAMRRAGEREAAPCFLIATACVAASALSYSTGFVAVPLVGAYALWLRLPWRWIAAYALAAGTFALHLVTAFRTPTGHPDLSLDLREIGIFAGVFLGGVIDSFPIALAVTAAALSLMGLGTLLLTLTRPRHFHALVPFLLIGAYAVANALLAAVSRADMGFFMALSSRYVNISSLLLISSILSVLILLSLHERPLSRAILAAIAAGLILPIVASATDPLYMRMQAGRERGKHLADVALELGVLDERLLRPVTPGSQILMAGVPALRTLGHAPLAHPHRCAGPLGRTLDVRPSEQGSFEQVTPLGEDHLLASGRVVAPAKDFACIAILDARSRVVGVGVMGLPDWRAHEAGAAGVIPWQAVMAPAEVQPPLTAALRYEGEAAWHRVGTMIRLHGPGPDR